MIIETIVGNKRSTVICAQLCNMKEGDINMPQNSGKRGRDDDFSFEIKKHFGVLSTSARGWNKEFNYVVWNGRDPKYDIREWQPDHEKMSKGVTLTKTEVGELLTILNDNAEEFRIDDDEEEESRPQDERLVS